MLDLADPPLLPAPSRLLPPLLLLFGTLTVAGPGHLGRMVSWKEQKAAAVLLLPCLCVDVHVCLRASALGAIHSRGVIVAQSGRLCLSSHVAQGVYDCC